jgi:hypothetical protein
MSEKNFSVIELSRQLTDQYGHNEYEIVIWPDYYVRARKRKTYLKEENLFRTPRQPIGPAALGITVNSMTNDQAALVIQNMKELVGEDEALGLLSPSEFVRSYWRNFD